MTDLLLAAADILDPPDRDVCAELGYIPEPAQKAFIEADEWDVGYGGRAGAGKSLALLMLAIDRCVHWPGLWAGIFRRTYDELQESILSKVLWMQDSLRERYGCIYIGSPRPELRFANGSSIRFRAAETLQDATKRQGGEYQLICIDERQQVHPDIAQYLMTRIRSGRSGLPVFGIRSTFNPGDVGHADLRERYIDLTDMGRHTYHERDPETGEPMVDHEGKLTERYIRFVEGKRSKHIHPSYWSQLEADPDPVRRRQLAHGDWDTGAGLMFSETWRRHIHVKSPEEFPVPEGAGVVRARGIDYGVTNPFCCLWGAVMGDGMVVVYRELYQAGLTPIEQAQLILASERPDERHIIASYLDPSCWEHYANAPRKPGAPPKSIAADFQACGLGVIKAQNDRIGGVRLVHQALRVQPDGMPRLIVSTECPNLIKQLGGLPRSKTNSEDVMKCDWDHAYDALRYLLYGLLGRVNDTGRPERQSRTVTAGVRTQAF